MPDPAPKPEAAPSRLVKTGQKLGTLVRRAIEWIGRHEASVLASLALSIAAIWVFVVVADEVLEGDTQKLDEAIVRALRRPDDPATPIGPGWLHEVGRDITALGGISTLVLLTAMVCGFLWLKRMYAAMWLVFGSTASGLVVSLLLKRLFERERPQLVPHLSRVYTHSFPSGHSMMSAVVFLTLGVLLGRFVQEFRLKAYFFLVALLLTFLVGVSRVYMGVHYPTDVLAGWAAGLAWALICWLIARYLQRHGAVEQAIDAS